MSLIRSYNALLRSPSSTVLLRSLCTATHHEQEWKNAKPYTEIPGPKPWPIVGNYKLFFPGFSKYDFTNLVTLHNQLRGEFGNIARISGLNPRNDLLFIYHPDDIETIFRNEGMWPMRPSFQSMNEYRTKTRRDFFKGLGGVLNDQGEAWQEARSQVNPVLMQTRTVQLYTSRIDNVAEDFVKRIPEWRDEKKEMPASFGNEIHKWALESIALVALDTRLGCLEPNLSPDSEPQKMIDAVHTMFKCLHVLELGGSMWKMYPTPTWNKFVSTMDFFVDVSMKYIKRSMDKMKEGTLSEDASVLERFLARDPNPTRVVIMALDMLMAGVDTTSHSLANFLLHLSSHPEKQEKLYAELKLAMPDPSTPLTTDILNQLTYLRACIKESMRLQPIATGNARTTRAEIVLSNYRIPKNVDIVMGNSVISRNEEYFPDANKFIPERWFRQREGTKVENPYPGVKINPFVSLPFGHGARKCVGMRFANLELETLIAKLVRRFRWEFHHGEMRYKTTIVHTPIDPLKFAVHIRE